MLERLAEIERRYEELERLVADPALVADRREYAKLARERSQLEETVRRIAGASDSSGTSRSTATCCVTPMPKSARWRAASYPPSKSELAALDVRLTLLLLPRDPNDDRNTVLEIRAGTGGDEAGAVRRRALPDVLALRRAPRLARRGRCRRARPASAAFAR